MIHFFCKEFTCRTYFFISLDEDEDNRWFCLDGAVRVVVKVRIGVGVFS